VNGALDLAPFRVRDLVSLAFQETVRERLDDLWNRVESVKLGEKRRWAKDSVGDLGLTSVLPRGQGQSGAYDHLNYQMRIKEGLRGICLNAQAVSTGVSVRSNRD